MANRKTLIEHNLACLSRCLKACAGNNVFGKVLLKLSKKLGDFHPTVNRDPSIECCILRLSGLRGAQLKEGWWRGGNGADNF